MSESMKLDELPNGWVASAIDVVTDVTMGQSPDSRFYNEKGVGFPFFQGKAEFGPVSPTVRKWCSEPTKIALPNDILISVRAPVGPTNLATERCCIGRGLASIRAKPPVDQNYIHKFLKYLGPWLSEQGTGTTFKAISGDFIRALTIPLAPLPEQKRIVDKLEVVLDRVDACRTRLDRVPALLKRFRQSVLAAAVSGTLTEEWRRQYDIAENADALLKRIQDARKAQWKGKYKEPLMPNENFLRQPPNTWRIASMDSLTSLITSGSRDWTKYYCDEGYAVFVMAQNVRPLRFDSSPVIRVAPPTGDRDKARSEIRKDDLLTTIVGANTGDICRVPSDFSDYYVCQSVALLRPAIPETSKYLELFLASEEHGQEQFNEYGYGQGRPHLSFDQLRSTAVFLPPLHEQAEIVRRVEALFAFADRIEARLSAAQATVTRLTPATLAKAFRGELVPQHSNDEPARVLLERLKPAQPAASETKTRRKRFSLK